LIRVLTPSASGKALQIILNVHQRPLRPGLSPLGGIP
jgi:hypothetical protein